jgi:hypothetical protein
MKVTIIGGGICRSLCRDPFAQTASAETLAELKAEATKPLAVE